MNKAIKTTVGKAMHNAITSLSIVFIMSITPIKSYLCVFGRINNVYSHTSIE